MSSRSAYAIQREHDMAKPLAFLRRMRLVRGRDFERTYREGRRARGSIVVLVMRPNELEHSRLGLSIGRSVWKSAVKRNRVRRIFREAFRLSYPDLPRGMDLVMIAARPRLEPELQATRAELVKLAQRIASSPAREAPPAPAPPVAPTAESS